MINKGIKSLLILIIVMMSVNNCGKGERIAPSVLLIKPNSNCMPPCWYEITPGVTKRYEVKELLANIPFVDVDSIEETSLVTSNDSISWKSKAEHSSPLLYIFTGMSYIEDFTGTIYFDEDIVTWIDIFFYRDITFGDLVNVLGEPERVMVVNIRGAERNIMSIVVLDPTRGYSFHRSYSTLYPPNPIHINKDDVAAGVHYYEPKEYINVLTNGLSENSIVGKLQEWRGFGEYQYYLVDPFAELE